jgi:hypothetical protein
MAGVFEDREQSYEGKWAHDEETLFRIMAKRDAWLGQWAAEAMQLPASEVDRYVKEVVNAGLTRKGKETVLEKIREDFSMRMLGCPDAVIERKMKDLFNQASEAILTKKIA